MKKIILTSSIIALASIIGTVSLVSATTQPVKQPVKLGSVAQGGEYHSTTTQDWGNVGAFDKQIVAGPGTLGSIVITVTAATKLRILDANASSTGGTATTTLATFVASPTVGTYTFDVQFYRGLYVIVDGGGASLASTTITYKTF